MDTYEFAKTSYQRLHPQEHRTWEALEPAAQHELHRFLEAAFDELIARQWHMWQIHYEIRPMRGISATWVFAASAKDAREVFERRKPNAVVRSVLRPQLMVQQFVEGTARCGDGRGGTWPAWKCTKCGQEVCTSDGERPDKCDECERDS